MICACGAVVIPIGALAVWEDGVRHGGLDCWDDPGGED